MKLDFERISGKRAKFNLFLALLVILALLGCYYSYLMFTKGYYITGMTNNVPWGIMKVLTIFFIGLSAGSLILSSISAVFSQKQYKQFARVAAYLAAILLIGALISLGFNLGRPERVLELFFHPNPESILSWNALFYTTYILLCFVYIFVMEKEMQKTIKVLGVIAVFIAILVHSGTGGIFGFIRARELYHSSLTPPSFVAAALSSGTALIIVLLALTFKCTNRFLDPRLLIKLSRLFAIFIIVVLYFLIVENLTRLSVYIFKDNSRFCAKCVELDLLTEMDTPNDTLRAMVEMIKEYAEDYEAQKGLFSKSPNRYHHLPYIERINRCKSDWEVLEQIEVRYGHIHL
ncbi:MAG: NrfD/PsrC family molybdoenzyme membrane anchor subunit [bacterium]